MRVRCWQPPVWQQASDKLRRVKFLKKSFKQAESLNTGRRRNEVV
jgi:hypothetical protein